MARPLRSFLKEVGKAKRPEGEIFSLTDHIGAVQSAVQAFLLPFEIPEYMCTLSYIASDLVRMSYDQVCNDHLLSLFPSFVFLSFSPLFLFLSLSFSIILHISFLFLFSFSLSRRMKKLIFGQSLIVFFSTFWSLV